MNKILPKIITPSVQLKWTSKLYLPHLYLQGTIIEKSVAGRVQFFAPKNGYLTKLIIILTSQHSEVFILFLSLPKLKPCPILRLNHRILTRKKDKFKDKKRIKRIIFLKFREVAKIQTKPKL